jgi:hypothetical protein
MDYWFQSITDQAQIRDEGQVLNLDSYIALRRDASGMHVIIAKPFNHKKLTRYSMTRTIKAVSHHS